MIDPVELPMCMRCGNPLRNCLCDQEPNNPFTAAMLREAKDMQETIRSLRAELLSWKNSQEHCKAQWEASERIIGRAERERDAALARAEKAERERDEARAECARLRDETWSLGTARDEALERIATLEEALGFYADEANWVCSDRWLDGLESEPDAVAFVDQGQRAREALAKR